MPFAAVGHGSHSVQVLRADPVRVVIRKRLGVLDDFGFVHLVSLGFLTTPGLPASGHADQILPSGWMTTVIPGGKHSRPPPVGGIECARS
jgi:hypothetical protein